MYAPPPKSALVTAPTDHKPSVTANAAVAHPTAATFLIPPRFEQHTSDVPNDCSDSPANVEHS